MVLVESHRFWLQKYHHTGEEIELTDTFVKNTKHTGAPAGDKHTDGGGLYLLVKAAGKYWRMNYRFADKQKTMTFGVYPAVSIVKARQRREKARELLADGIGPNAEAMNKVSFDLTHPPFADTRAYKASRNRVSNPRLLAPT
jgi:hypothetical protein